jgi:hypothetical protein
MPGVPCWFTTVTTPAIVPTMRPVPSR